MNTTAFPTEYVTLAALGTTVMSYLWLQCMALRYWSGVPGWFSGLPLIVWALCIQSLFAELKLDPYSHNLWPFEIAMWTVGAAAGLFIISWFQVPQRAKKRVVRARSVATVPAVPAGPPVEAGFSPLEYKQLMLMRNLEMVSGLLQDRQEKKDEKEKESLKLLRL